MFFVEPPQTPYDLNFELAGVPVRVHPLFWVFTLFLGLNAGDTAAILIWLVAVFVSILVHEMGHALAAVSYGFRPRVVLHQFGGLAIYQPTHRIGLGEVVITAAGPGAGFLFAAGLVVLLRALGLEGPFLGWNLGGERFIENRNLNELIGDLLYVNLMWGAINLLPIFPLDGGQISRQLLIRYWPGDGWRLSLWISVIAAAGMALWSWQATGGRSLYTVLFFGWLAFSSYQMLDQFGGGWGRR